MSSIINNMPMSTVLSLISSIASLTTTPTKHDIFNNTILRNKVLIFIYDVHTHHTSPTSRARLAQAAKSPSHLGLPYFTPSEVEILSSVELKHDLTLGDKIKSAIRTGNQRRQELVDVNGVAHYSLYDCSALDISTVLEQTFVIRGNQIRLNFEIKEAIVECGFETDRPRREAARRILSSPPLFHQTKDNEV